MNANYKRSRSELPRNSCSDFEEREDVEGRTAGKSVAN